MTAFDHLALLYRDAGELLAGTLSFVRAGLAASEPVAVAVPGANLDRIRDGLGADAGRVTFHDMTRAGGNPGRILPAVLLAFANAHPDRPVRIVEEQVWPGRTPLEYPACVQHEALINAVFAGRAARILCPYDVAGLAPEAIDDAHRTHPAVITPEGRVASPRYADPVALAESFNLPLPDPPADATMIAVDLTGLAKVRAFVIDLAEAAGLGADRADDLMIAVNELATNTVAHTPGQGTLSAWTEGGDLVCQVRDGGHIADPLAGRVPPPLTSSTGGRGLILVNQLCDLVRVHSRPGATTIRLHMRLSAR
ncbi:anti-sigma factor RsbA family regulatory protein [Phytohabitans kaempferiae]|uniref:Anti-sigma factor RsbA family regulatory protein n=1 Tax=Phytohabitans kaempferiae TaxID=1620943 RepID=A0ABV6M2B7_9ACTN